MTVFAVVNEGWIDDVELKDGTGIIVTSSVWPTRAEAQFAIDRVFSTQFGTWKPKQRWIEERDDSTIALSNLDHNAPELTFI